MLCACILIILVLVQCMHTTSSNQAKQVPSTRRLVDVSAAGEASVDSRRRKDMIMLGVSKQGPSEDL